jgi:hypothetical protein
MPRLSFTGSMPAAIVGQLSVLLPLDPHWQLVVELPSGLFRTPTPPLLPRLLRHHGSFLERALSRGGAAGSSAVGGEDDDFCL